MTNATASSSTQSVSQTGKGGYGVGRPLGVCHVTQRAIEPGAPFFAALRETPEGFERLEFLPEAWQEWPDEEKKRLLAFWRSTMREPQQEKRKLLVDDEVLAELFRRLEGVGGAEREKQAFRFMLGLILMRKKLLLFENSRHEADHDVWQMRFRKEEQTWELIDPKLAEAELDAVGRQVGQILNGGIDEDALEESGADATGEGQ